MMMLLSNFTQVFHLILLFWPLLNIWSQSFNICKYANSTEEDQNSKSNTKCGLKRRLYHFDEFLLVLMHLKVGLFLNDLADRFGISVFRHASKILTTWINFLFHELPLLFPYPSKDLVQRLLPPEFQCYPTTRIIIDCTEIFMEVPSSLKSQSQTWSD